MLLPNPSGVTVSDAAATAINDGGVVAGYVIVTDPDGSEYSQAVTWSTPDAGRVR